MAGRNTYKEDEILETPFDFKHLLRASVYVKKYAKKMIFALFLSAIGAITGLFAPIITQRALDVAIPNKDQKLLLTLVLILVASYTISILFTTFRSRIMTKVGQDIIFDIRKDLFEHLQKLSFQYYDDRPHGKILVRVVNYVNSVSDMLSNGLINVILESLNLIFIIIFMFSVDVKLSIVVLCGVPVLAVFMFWIKKSLLLMVCMFFMGCLSLVFGIVFNYLCQVYIISTNFYIACSFINYSIKYGEMTRATVTQAEVDDTAKEENKSASAIDAYEQRFGEKLARWMEEKKYLSAQFTIADLATEMGTNKLYMSRYINRKYEVNFSTLITRLRLSEAKEYMLAHPNVKQEEVALHSGFSSSSYFSKVFSREEGITPVLWRKAQTASLPYEM